MTEPRKDVCETCLWYWKPDETNTREGFILKYIDGFCRRHAPKEVAHDGVLDLQWPPIRRSDWCGDHRKRVYEQPLSCQHG